MHPFTLGAAVLAGAIVLIVVLVHAKKLVWPGRISAALFLAIVSGFLVMRGPIVPHPLVQAAAVPLAGLAGWIAYIINWWRKKAEPLGSAIAVGAGLFLLIQFGVYIGRNVDDVDLPFRTDPALVGAWEAVDVVTTPADFRPANQHVPETAFFFREIDFKPDGTTDNIFYSQWTQGRVIAAGYGVAGDYRITSLDGQDFLFVQWKNGNTVYLHFTPDWYVFKRIKQKKAE